MSETDTSDEQDPVDAPDEDVLEAAEEAPQEDLAAEPMTEPEPALEAIQEATGKSSAFMGVPIEILVSVGKARPRVNELVKLRRDSVISLDSKIEDPVEIYVGDRLIARGELQEMEDSDGQLGVRLTEVADLSNGV